MRRQEVRVEACIQITDQNEFVMGIPVIRQRGDTRQKSIRKNFRVLCTQAIEDDDELFGSYLFADEGVFERAAAQEGEIWKAVCHATA